MCLCLFVCVAEETPRLMRHSARISYTPWCFVVFVISKPDLVTNSLFLDIIKKVKIVVLCNYNRDMKDKKNSLKSNYVLFISSGHILKCSSWTMGRNRPLFFTERNNYEFPFLVKKK